MGSQPAPYAGTKEKYSLQRIYFRLVRGNANGALECHIVDGQLEKTKQKTDNRKQKTKANSTIDSSGEGRKRFIISFCSPKEVSFFL